MPLAIAAIIPLKWLYPRPQYQSPNSLSLRWLWSAPSIGYYHQIAKLLFACVPLHGFCSSMSLDSIIDLTIFKLAHFVIAPSALSPSSNVLRAPMPSNRVPIHPKSIRKNNWFHVFGCLFVYWLIRNYKVKNLQAESSSYHSYENLVFANRMSTFRVTSMTCTNNIISISPIPETGTSITFAWIFMSTRRNDKTKWSFSNIHILKRLIRH